MSDSQRSGEPPPECTADEVLQVLRGTASEEIKQRFLRAGEDIFSDTTEMLRGISRWARRRLPRVGGPSADEASWQRLDAIILFVREKRHAGVFTYEETRSWVMPGTWSPEKDSSYPSAAENNALATRILRAIDRSHPELKSELEPFRSDRRR